ncbi:hypothetical protein FUA23_00830 [Neolewinella aurantiaca]|uniref:SPOR domain-containing protein n=1 Tax=Neolewinella aurantiaca TaxID=2602767 RepID=A0A5C7G1H5_9BACT|nr:RlpA-like double-psi beta-barrel domain-containing protein [Neolewinella aurantiaca]TXF91762.1 hypothetical protein FUA23_00830 [Neolewinella aurantiaca]
MKYLLTFALAFVAITASNAQTFEWNTKSAEAHPNEVSPNDPSRIAFDKAYNERQIGMAGVYNPNAQGQRTAYNETYVNKQLTASHALLPLGTLVRVQNLDNNRFVSVRINDKGQECSDCLLMLSQAAATQLGINYRGRVSVERTGFSNWNPAPPPTNYTAAAAPQAYGTQSSVTRPVQINNSQWQARGNSTPSPVAYGAQTQNTQQATTYSQPSAYGTANAQATSGNYAVLSAPTTPSVVSREVQPATVSNQPTTYSRYPTAATPAPTYNQPRVYQAAPSTYNTPAPVYQQPVPVQQQPVTQQPTTQQATPPPSTVKLYQESRTVPAPATYQTPTAYSTPQAYNPANVQARGVANPTASAPVTTAREYVVQLGAYNNEAYAQARVDQLQKMGLSNIFYRSVQKPDGQLINRVYAGTFGTMAEAQQAGKIIQGTYQIAGIASVLH